jgi:hypothetical protein
MSTQDDNSGISLDSDPQDKHNYLDDDSVTPYDHKEQQQQQQQQQHDETDGKAIVGNNKELVQSQKGTHSYIRVYLLACVCIVMH